MKNITLMDLKKQVSDLSGLETEIRSHFNESQYKYCITHEDHNRICCVLDTSGDNCIAVYEYLASPSFNNSIGYLPIHGLLGVLVTQQNAVDDLMKSFGSFPNPGTTLTAKYPNP